MRRIRWFGADWPVSLRTLAAKMRANPFKEDSLDGFIVDRVREGSVEGRFIEKISYQETITNPFGEERVFDHVVYRQLEFNLSATFPNIELWDAPRSTQVYVNKLLEFSNFAVSIDPISVDLIQWANVFESTVRGKITIDSIQISGLEIERGVTAKIVVSGDKDVRDALQRIAKAKRYELEIVQLKLFSDGVLVPIHLTNTGSVRLEAAHIDAFLPGLRSSLPKARRNGTP